MKKYILSLAVFVLAITFFVTGCNKDSDKLEGVWNYYSNNEENKSIYYTFGKDNKGSYTFYDGVQNFTYEDTGKKVIIYYKDTTDPNEYEYNIKDGVLNIQDSFGDYITYKKSK